jgi:succinate dehydrogenase/fumarate reductase flavoprotein subunit
MSITTNTGEMPAEVKRQLQQTLADLSSGVRDADKMKAACRRMDQMREENRRLLGEQNIVVELVREARDRQ